MVMRLRMGRPMPDDSPDLFVDSGSPHQPRTLSIICHLPPLGDLSTFCIFTRLLLQTVLLKNLVNSYGPLWPRLPSFILAQMSA